MNLLKLIQYLRDRLKTVIRVCLGVLVLLVLADIFLVNNAEAHTKIEHIPAFWSIYGFVACVLIIILSKWFGHLGIMTREDYYEEGAGVRPSSGAASSADQTASGHAGAPGKSKPAAPGDGRPPRGGHHE